MEGGVGNCSFVKCNLFLFGSEREREREREIGKRKEEKKKVLKKNHRLLNVFCKMKLDS